MKAVFHQSYFLPWLGYFSKLEFVDTLVILDDVGFRRNHIKRVQILGSQGNILWFCLPVGNNWAVPCNSIELPTERKYIDKMLHTIFHSYRKAKYFNTEYPFIETIFSNALTNNIKLIDANLEMLIALRNHIYGKQIQILSSSDFYDGIDRSERIIEICKANSITEIIMGDGRMASVHNLETIQLNGIKILRQNFNENQPTYEQVHSKRNGIPFIKGLSIIDALFNIGAEDVKKIISNPIYTPQSITLYNEQY